LLIHGVAIATLDLIERARNYNGVIHDLEKTDGLWEVTLEAD